MINLLITFVCRRYAVVVVSYLRRGVRVHVLAYYIIFWPLSVLTSKRRCFILAHNIWLNVQHSFSEPARTFSFSRMS